MKILAHTSFIGTTGYNNHARSFFCALNKLHTVKVRNLTVGDTWKGQSNRPHDTEPYITDEMKDMMILQSLYNSDGTRSDYPIYDYQGDFKPDINIILNDTYNPYFYDKYDGYTIAYNVWESTRYPDDFFQTLHRFDEVWVPTQWQYDSLVEQGYPKHKISIVTEGVDVEVFKPTNIKPRSTKFRFLLFGRWEYRKSTTEIIRTFGETFKDNNKVELICSVENKFPYDGTNSTEERIEKHNLHYKNVKYIKFPPRNEYVKYLKEGHVFVSCSRSEGWNLPACEALSCGTPTIYSNWGGQLQFAKDKGIPVKIKGLIDPHFDNEKFVGEFCEPDFEDLAIQMKNVHKNYDEYKKKAIEESKIIHKEFNWDKVAKNASKILENKNNLSKEIIKKSVDLKRIMKKVDTGDYIKGNIDKELLKIDTEPFVFVSAGNLDYMPTIEKLVESLNEFSKNKIIIYGIDCDIPFDFPNMIKRRIDPPKHSKYDRWYWKQYVCIESLKENYERFVWIDGDVVVNYNIDTIEKYFSEIENYPLSDIHIPEEFSGYYIDKDGNRQIQLFNEKIRSLWNIPISYPYMHICMYIYNKDCKWWFEQIIKEYLSIDLKSYETYFLWNDEGIDNALRWKYGFKKHLPLSNFDTSGYDGDDGFTSETLNQFYKFWNERGPQNFNKVYGYQFIPEDKSQIIYFHGNKNRNISDKIIECVKFKKNNNFHQSHYFYTDVYKLQNLGKIYGIKGGTMDVAMKYGWEYAGFHEIYNLTDYYLNREKRIHDGDIVVDLGGNIGVFTRWAYEQGASKVITFEPDDRYFKLLKLNSDPRTMLFNAAMSDSIGTTTLYESSHLGGSSILGVLPSELQRSYTVRTYTLDYLFETGLIDKIDFLKIDIEGAEIQVLKGISDDNLRKIRTIAMEYHHSHLNYDEDLRANFIKRLNQLGFNSHLLFLGSNNALQMIYFSKFEPGTYRFDIINSLIKKYNYKSYLEIGTQNPAGNFDRINIEHKFCIDPVPLGKIDFIGTSDEYFQSIHNTETKFDIIFIDGLHLNEQVFKDIENSLLHLNDNGTIVCHDCLPSSKELQERNISDGQVCSGDVWKAIAKLRIERTDLDINVVDTDYGCGIIRRGKNIPYPIENNELTYEFYSQNKHELLNVISLSNFNDRYK
jgi:FkbM family methyltransferase